MHSAERRWWWPLRDLGLVILVLGTLPVWVVLVIVVTLTCRDWPNDAEDL